MISLCNFEKIFFFSASINLYDSTESEKLYLVSRTTVVSRTDAICPLDKIVATTGLGNFVLHVVIQYMLPFQLIPRF